MWDLLIWSSFPFYAYKYDLYSAPPSTQKHWEKRAKTSFKFKKWKQAKVVWHSLVSWQLWDCCLFMELPNLAQERYLPNLSSLSVQLATMINLQNALQNAHGCALSLVTRKSHVACWTVLGMTSAKVKLVLFTAYSYKTLSNASMMATR